MSVSKSETLLDIARTSDCLSGMTDSAALSLTARMIKDNIKLLDRDNEVEKAAVEAIKKHKPHLSERIDTFVANGCQGEP